MLHNISTKKGSLNCKVPIPNKFFSILVDPEQAVQARMFKYNLRNTNFYTNVLGVFVTKSLNKMFSISVNPEQAIFPVNLYRNWYYVKLSICSSEYTIGVPEKDTTYVQYLEHNKKKIITKVKNMNNTDINMNTVRI